VLKRLQGKLCALLLLQLETHHPVLGAVIIERDRHQLLSLGSHGNVERLAELVSLVLRRYGVTHADAIPQGDPVEAALAAAGMTRIAVRRELLRNLP
jgi:hypothetical protein